jgi:hypothetical protein
LDGCVLFEACGLDRSFQHPIYIIEIEIAEHG